jgi:hypothetical protein
MRAHEKTEAKMLFSCPAAVCRVVTFTATSVLGEKCPGCGEAGLLLRYPVVAPKVRSLA